MVGRRTIDGIKPVEATIGSKRFELGELTTDAVDDGVTIELGAEPVGATLPED